MTHRTGNEICLRSMPQLAEAVDKEDDWTGITDAAARRKRQNRLNVRAHRRRKALQATSVSQSTLVSAADTSPNEPLSAFWIEDRHSVSILPASLAKTLTKTRPLFFDQQDASHSQLDPNLPNVQIIFPLSQDHLMTLVQYNVLRAAMNNLALLSLLHTVPPECPSVLVPSHDTDDTSLSSFDPTKYTSTTHPNIPHSLRPTHLQQTVPHEPWIDVIPHPQWRDNMIMAAGTYDEDEMSSDIVGGLWEGFPDSEVAQRGLIAWNNPWDVSGWEVSEGFCKKWGWLLKGCGEVIEAANRWRDIRGEERLIVEL